MLNARPACNRKARARFRSIHHLLEPSASSSSGGVVMNQVSEVDGFAGRGREVREASEPNLLRDTFPYHAVPKIEFDNVIEAPDPAPEFFITDTTFRDGQQARPPYTVDQIVALYAMLHRLGGPNGIIRQTEFFLYSEVDREAVTRCLGLGC